VRRFVAWLLGWEVVWLRLAGGEVRCRLAQPTPFGLYVYGTSRVWKLGGALCLPGGKIEGACYVYEWRRAANGTEQ
jgi:hypothetical protein